MAKILEIVQAKYHKGKLYEKLMDFTLYFDRRITEYYFIANIVSQQTMIDHQPLSTKIEMEINDIRVFKAEMIEHSKKLAYYFVNLNIPSLFSHYQHHYHQLEKELLNNYHILQSLPKNTYVEIQISQEIKAQIPKKIEELTSFVIIHSQPKEQDIVSLTQKLLNFYANSQLEMKMKIIYKLAKIF